MADPTADTEQFSADGDADVADDLSESDEVNETARQSDEANEAGRIKRIAQIIGGVILVIAGIIMSGPGIPGPGLVSIVVGLNLIKPDNALYKWLRRKAPGVPNEGPIPKRQLVIGALITIVFVVVGIIYGPRLSAWVFDALGIDFTMPWS